MLIWRVVTDFIKDKEYRELLITSFVVLAVGTIIFHYLEGWSVLDSLYFCVITLTTVGYGDLAPETDIGKIFNMMYIVIGLGLILTFIRTVYDHYYITKTKIKRDNK